MEFMDDHSQCIFSQKIINSTEINPLSEPSVQSSTSHAIVFLWVGGSSIGMGHLCEYWLNYWHILISKDTSGFTSNTLLIGIQYCYQ